MVSMNPMRRVGLTTIAGLLSMALLMGADPAAYKKALEAGLELYNEEKLDQAEAKFLDAERNAATDPQRAKARYHLGLIYYNQKKWDKALAALDDADKLDPKTTFTKNTAQYRQKLSAARANVSLGSKRDGSARAPRAPQSSDPLREPVLKALTTAEKGGVWDFANLLEKSQKDTIESRIRKYAKNSLHFYVVTVDTGAGGRTHSLFTDQIFRERGFKKGDTLFVVSKQGVYGKSVDIPDKKLNESIQASRHAFLSSFGDGILFLLDDVQGKVGSAQAKSTAGSALLLIILLGIGAAITFAVMAARRKKAVAFEDKFAEAVKLESEVLEQIDIVRTKVNLGDDARLKDLMRRTEERYTDAHTALEQLKNERQKRDVPRADAIINMLRGILKDLDQLKSGEAPGQGGFAPGAGPSSAGPVGYGPGGEALDGNCFFCSNPVNSQTAERAQITMGDQSQTVLMCSYCADYRRRTGQMPRVLARTYQGQPVHWKDDPSYSPPAQPQNIQQQGGFFGGGGGMSFFDMWMLSNLFNRPSHDRVIFVDRDSGSQRSGYSYDVDESRSRSAGSNYRHESSVDPEERQAAPGMDFYSKDRS